ncbi:MAG: glycoside hydrolase family 16 protein [Flavobacteriaceae bacterium]|nr:glycoside hydrolase family 16 protein [Flavobacteriaceae bacterium]
MRNLTALLILFLLLSCEKDSDSPDTSFFSLEVSSGEGGSVSISAGNYPEGSNLSIQAVPLADYNFSSWSGSLSSTANPLEITLTQNLQLQANFVKKQFELNVSVTGEGSVDQKLLNSGKSYEIGSQVELSATPATGWEFEQWTGGIESTENPVTINLTEAKEVTAIFVRKQYNLNLTITGEGTVNEQIISQPAQYDFETQVRLTAVAANDWEFDSWSGDISGSNNPIELSIDKEYQLGANFKLKDTDLDGVPDRDDSCPNTSAGTQVNQDGCPVQSDVPLVAAPTPTQDAADVISIFSDSYDDAVAGINYNPNWGQSTQTTIETVEGNEVLKYANLNYQGTDWASTPIDVSSKTTVHIDYWTADASSFNFYIISPGPQEKAYNITPTAGEWGSADIPLSHFDNVNLADLIQIKVGEGGGTLYLDNIYFYGDNGNGDGGGDGGGNNNLELIWSDEFDYEGRPDSSKWHHQTFAPNGGSWFNGELQHYVDKENTTYVTNGTLKIVARKETYTTQNSTKEYTSARLNSKFDFKYGRIDVRAKLPSGAGTWPAIWTLGSNINEAGNYFGDSKGSVGWPACGEIDIMEQNGWDKTRSYGYFHWANTQTGEYQYDGTTTFIADSSSAFHLYSLIWDETKMQILLDNVVFMELPNEASNPFDNPHYLLLNIAIGGNLGGEVPANFPNQVMEVDYVRIYQ